MDIQIKNTSGGEFVLKQSGEEYVGQYYILDGVIYAGNANSGVTGANNGKNPRQQTQLVRQSDFKRDNSGYVNTPFGEDNNFAIKLRQDVYDTVPEIIDTEVSELKPLKTSTLTPEEILQNRIDDLFKEYSSLREQVNKLGSQRSHEFLVNSSLPYTDNFDSETEIVENLPTYNIEESTTLVDVQITTYPELKGVNYYQNNPEKFPFYYEEFDQRDPKGNPGEDGYHGIGVIDANFWVQNGRQDIANYLVPKIANATLDDIPLYDDELVGELIPDDIILFEKKVIETREFIESSNDSETIETIFGESDFQPGAIRTTKKDFEIEQLLHERGDEVNVAHIDFLQGEVDRLRALIAALEAQLEALGVQNGNLNEQLNGTLAQLQEELEDDLVDLVEDEGKGDVFWSEPFEFGEDQAIGERPFMEGWVSSSGCELVPTGGILGKGGVLVKRTSTNWQSIGYKLYLQAYQTYTFTAYGRFGNLPSDGDLKVWIGDGRRPTTQPDYLSWKPFDWMYNWAADCSTTKQSVENTNGEWKFLSGSAHSTTFANSNKELWSSINRARYGQTAVSGTREPDGTTGGQYQSDAQGKWYKVEFDFTPQPNSYHNQEFDGVGLTDDRYVNAPYIEANLLLYPGTYTSSPGQRGLIGDYVEWSDIKIYKRKSSNYRPFRDSPIASRLSMVNRPIDYDPEAGSNNNTLVSRFYDSKEIIDNRIYVFDRTYYRTYPELFERDKFGVRWRFNPTSKRFEHQGLIMSPQDSNANENQSANFEYGKNLIKNPNFMNGMDDWVYDEDDIQDSIFIRYWKEDVSSNLDYDFQTNSANISDEDKYGKKYTNGDTSEMYSSTPNVDWPPELGNRVARGGTDNRAFCYQIIDINGVAENDYFKLSAWCGGIDTQDDVARVYVKFYDENENIIPAYQENGVPIISPVDYDGQGSAANGGILNGFPVYHKKVGTDGVYISDIKTQTDAPSPLNRGGYYVPTNGSTNGRKDRPWFMGYVLDWLGNTERGNGDNLKYTVLTSKVPVRAAKAVVTVYTHRDAGSASNGYATGIFFKITKPDNNNNAPDLNWELE